MAGGDPLKRLFAFIFAIMCFGVMVGCSEKEASEQELVVYSFSGSDGQIAVSNGVIVMSPDKDVFYGGDLEVFNEELCTDIASYSTTFYTMNKGKRNTILSNSVVDQTDGSVNVSGDLGKMSGANLLIGNKVDASEDLLHSLFFELRITPINGEQRVYEVQMEVTEITD